MTTSIKIAAAILAGGKAKRLGGIEKGNISLGNETIISRLIKELEQTGLINEIVIISNNPKNYTRYSKPIIKDLRLDMGPLSGVETALTHYQDRYDAVLFLPCDLPSITATEVEKLYQAFLQYPSLVFAETPTHQHPLCCIIAGQLRAKISTALDQGYRKITQVWNNLENHRVFFTDEQKFLNVNSRIPLQEII